MGMIQPPFANYPRARLERLVREGWELIERRAAMGPGYLQSSVADFMVLSAADAYLRSLPPAKDD
jgi:hypothetical protein